MERKTSNYLLSLVSGVCLAVSTVSDFAPMDRVVIVLDLVIAC